MVRMKRHVVITTRGQGPREIVEMFRWARENRIPVLLITSSGYHEIGSLHGSRAAMLLMETVLWAKCHVLLRERDVSAFGERFGEDGWDRPE